MQRFTVCLLALFVPVGAARAEVIIDTDTTLDYDVSDSVRVIAGASPPTTVQFLEPGNADNMTVYDDSIVNMTAGYIGGYLEGYDSATLNVFDGFFGLGLKAHDQSTLNVSGGGTELLYVYDESVTDFSGGYYELVKVRDSAHMDIRGNAKMEHAVGLGDQHDGHLRRGPRWAGGQRQQRDHHPRHRLQLSLWRDPRCLGCPDRHLGQRRLDRRPPISHLRRRFDRAGPRAFHPRPVVVGLRRAVCLPAEKANALAGIRKVPISHCRPGRSDSTISANGEGRIRYAPGD